MTPGEKQIRNLRHMAWERAKGELNSIRHTYWPEHDGDTDKHKKFTQELDTFIKSIESNGLHE